MKTGSIAAFLLGIGSTAISVAAAANPLVTGALAELDARATADRLNFYIYKDADSGFNHGFPSGFIGAKEFTINAACLDDPTAPAGCSTDPNGLDQVRGTVFQINFAPQLPGTFSGLIFEEPQGFVGGSPGAGYVLNGATSIVFLVRSPTGINVQFGAGGSTTPFVTIPASTAWTKACIAVQGSAAAVCPADSVYQLDLGSSGIPLNSVNQLFSAITNDINAPNGGVLLLDDIQYEPTPTAQTQALSLPLSTQTFGVVPSATAAGAPPDQVNRNVATVYEASLAVIYLLAEGDTAAAIAIADALVYALGHDNQGFPLPAAPDGAIGLHNAYEAGDLVLLNGQGPGGGAAGQVRLAGFSIAPSAECGPAGFCLVLTGATGGNNAFAILALVKAFQATGNPVYLNAATTIGNWIFEQLLDGSGNGFGGYFLGYPDGGQAEVLQTSKSTENNSDIFAAFSALAGAVPTAAPVWQMRAKIAGDFVIAMFDRQRGCFNAGTVPAGTPASFGVAPNGPQKGNDVVNTFDFLDANSFSYLAMSQSAEYGGGIRWARAVRCLAQFRAAVAVAGTQFQGYDAVVSSPQSDGIAWEFTSQVAVVLAQSGGKSQRIRHWLETAQLQASFGDRTSLVAATLNGGDMLSPANQCLNTPFQCIPERIGIAATAWGGFAGAKLYPFR